MIRVLTILNFILPTKTSTPLPKSLPSLSLQLGMSIGFPWEILNNLNSSVSPWKQADDVSSVHHRCTKSLPKQSLPTTSIANSYLACSRIRVHGAELCSELPDIYPCWYTSVCLKDCKAALQCLLLWMYQHCVLISREQHMWFNRVLFPQSYPQPFLVSSNLMILSCVQIFVQRLSPPTFPHH